LGRFDLSRKMLEPPIARKQMASRLSTFVGLPSGTNLRIGPEQRTKPAGRPIGRRPFLLFLKQWR